MNFIRSLSQSGGHRAARGSALAATHSIVQPQHRKPQETYLVVTPQHVMFVCVHLEPFPERPEIAHLQSFGVELQDAVETGIAETRARRHQPEPTLGVV